MSEIIDESISVDAISAARNFISHHINSGHETSFIVIDSKLISLQHAGEDTFGEMLEIEYAYFSVRVDDLKEGVFNDYVFYAESMLTYVAELCDSNGFYSPNDEAGSFGGIQFSDPKHTDLINAYRSETDTSDFCDRIFAAIQHNDQIYDEVFSFSEIGEFEDIRAFCSAIETTLKQIESDGFDPQANDQWWSDAYNLTNENTAMFRRILTEKFLRLQKLIIEIESKKRSEIEISVTSKDVTCHFDGTTLDVRSSLSEPSLIVHAEDARESIMGVGSATGLINKAKNAGSEVRSLKGVFGGRQNDHLCLIVNIDAQTAQKIVDATKQKLGVWIQPDSSADILDLRNYFDFDQCRYI